MYTIHVSCTYLRGCEISTRRSMKNEMDIEHLSYDLPNRRLSIIHEIISKKRLRYATGPEPKPPRTKNEEKNEETLTKITIFHLRGVDIHRRRHHHHRRRHTEDHDQHRGDHQRCRGYHLLRGDELAEPGPSAQCSASCSSCACLSIPCASFRRSDRPTGGRCQDETSKHRKRRRPAASGGQMDQRYLEGS